MPAPERKKRILVCDDDDVLVELLEMVLETAGYEVTGTTDGTSCLEAFDRVKPDLLLLDIEIPHLDGFQVLERLNQEGKTREVKVFMMSADERTEDLLRCRRMGASSYITKPFEITLLQEEVDKALKTAVPAASQPAKAKAASR